MPGFDVEAQRRLPEPTVDQSVSWLRARMNTLVGRPYPGAPTLIEDLNTISTTATTFATSINTFVGGNAVAQQVIEITNAVSALGTTAAQGVVAYRNGEIRDPAYIAANVVSAALSVGRLAVDHAMAEGQTKVVTRFAIDMAQMATQVAKWGTKPSAVKAKGGEHGELSAKVSDLEREVRTLQSSAAASLTSSGASARSAPVEYQSRPRTWAVRPPPRSASR